MGIDVGRHVDRSQRLGQGAVSALERRVLMEELLELALLERIEGPTGTPKTHLLGDLRPHCLDVYRRVAHTLSLTSGPPAVRLADRGRFRSPEALPWYTTSSETAFSCQS